MSTDRQLANVHNELRNEWYRSPIEPTTLRQLMQRSNLQGGCKRAGTWP